MNEQMSDFKENEKQGAVGQFNQWIMGGVFILVGGVLLLRNVLGFSFDNWWVLFWLIPLGGLASAMWGQYRVNGRFNPGLLIGAASLLFMMAVFLFNLNWGALWPFFFILGGLAMLLSRR